jgi:hypothetical protein
MTLRIFVLGWVLAFGAAVAWAQDEDSKAIAHAMKKQFDRPDAPLQVAPVTVIQGYAVAGWLQTGKGGRALLQKTQGAWNIIVCAGDGLKDAKVLESTGMSAATALQMSRAVIGAESKLSADTRQRFASFEGFLKIGPAGAGASHGAHHAPVGHAPSGASTH